MSKNIEIDEIFVSSTFVSSFLKYNLLLEQSPKQSDYIIRHSQKLQ